MKKVAVSTYCVWTSYGSILQSFALKRALGSIGINSYIFSDEPIDDPYNLTGINKNSGLKGFLASSYLRFNRKHILSKYSKTKNFMKEYLDIVEYKDYQDLLKNIPSADYYLSGSDQVFNPLKCSPAFFLDFVKDKSRCFSYACSMGETNVPLQKEEYFSRLINNFSTISCREEDNIPILKNYNPSAIYFNHIDPTFLLDSNEWLNTMTPYTKIKKPFILVFPIFWDKKYNEQLKKLHDTTHIDIVTICNGFSRVYANKRLLDVSVSEFLWLINNAEGVVSSSFHGVSLALILNKNLSVIVNPKLPSRISCLLNKLDAKPLAIEDLVSGKMNYDTINDNIRKEKDRGIEYLKEIFCE